MKKHVVYVIVTSLTIIFSVYLIFRVFLFDRFPIQGCSMEPTLTDGNVVYVNKLIIGPRIYVPSLSGRHKMKFVRLPGFRNVLKGDIVVFNGVDWWGAFPCRFKMNYLLCKRCLGCPGGETNGVYIPKCGDSILMSLTNYRLYRRIIEYETGEYPTLVSGKVLISGKCADYYTFRKDWYFFVGDNRDNSWDSRFFGLVPEEFIVGVVKTYRLR